MKVFDLLESKLKFMDTTTWMWNSTSGYMEYQKIDPNIYILET